MLELFAIYQFCQYFGKRLRAKGRSPTPWQMLFIAMWFSFEIIGGIMGTLFTGEVGVGAYIIALIGAGCSILILHLLIQSMPNLRPNAGLFDAARTHLTRKY